MYSIYQSYSLAKILIFRTTFYGGLDLDLDLDLDWIKKNVDVNLESRSSISFQQQYQDSSSIMHITRQLS